MRPAQLRLPSEAAEVESLMHEIRPACFVLYFLALETVLDLASLLFGWLCKLLGRERTLQSGNAVPKSEVREVIEINCEHEEAAVYRSPDWSSIISVKNESLFYPCCGDVRSSAFSDLFIFCPRLGDW